MGCEIPKFLFLGRISEEDLSGSRQVEIVELPIRLVVLGQTGLGLVAAVGAVVGRRCAGVGGLAGERPRFESVQGSKPALSGAKHGFVCSCWKRPTTRSLPSSEKIRK